jgi:hypothetical protein
LPEGHGCSCGGRFTGTQLPAVSTSPVGQVVDLSTHMPLLAFNA